MSRCDAVLCPREYGDKTPVPLMILSLSFNESRTSPIVIYDPKSSFAKLFQLHYVCVCVCVLGKVAICVSKNRTEQRALLIGLNFIVQ